MINKKFIHFDRFATFNTKKLSVNAANTQYKVGVEGDTMTGSPDIMFQSIVFIKDEGYLFTHGKLYNASGEAIKLRNASTINNTLFTGESDITTAIWGQSRKFAIKDSSNKNSGASVSINGGRDVVLNLPSTIDAKVTKDDQGNTISTTYTTKSEFTAALDEFDRFYVYCGEDDTTPTLTSKPASDWTTSELKEEHAGSFYITSEGRIFRFIQKTDETWIWDEITDRYLYSCMGSLKAMESRLDFLTDWDKLHTTADNTITHGSLIYVKDGRQFPSVYQDSYYLDIITCPNSVVYKAVDSGLQIYLPFLIDSDLASAVTFMRTRTTYLSEIPRLINRYDLDHVIDKTITITNDSSSGADIEFYFATKQSGETSVRLPAGYKFCLKLVAGQGSVSSKVNYFYNIYLTPCPVNVNESW